MRFAKLQSHRHPHIPDYGRVTHVSGLDPEFMVSAAGFEPATHALKGLAEREINNLSHLNIS